MIGVFLTHIAAQEAGKPPFFFSRWNFQRMMERGNDYYCCHCIGGFGFKLDEDGELADHTEESGYNPMERHGETHTEVVIGNATQYPDVWAWLAAEVPEDFIYVVHVPSLS